MTADCLVQFWAFSDIRSGQLVSKANDPDSAGVYGVDLINYSQNLWCVFEHLIVVFPQR